MATSRNVQLADPRPAGLEEVFDAAPEDRPVTQNGVFGQWSLLETGFSETATAPAEGAPGQRPLTENTISNVVGSAMEDLPIWVGPNDRPTDPPPPPPVDPPKPDCPPVDPPSPPTDPADPDCMKVTDKERELIEFIRKQAMADGETAFDWMALIAAIMEIVRIIQQGRA